MQYAVRHGNIEVLAELLDNGANIHAKLEREQMTLLEWAVYGRHLDVMRMLLQRGASTDHCKENGVDAYVCCWITKDYSYKRDSALEAYNILNEYATLHPKHTYFRNITVLHGAAQFADGADVDALISNGNDIEAKDDDGHTALAYAARNGTASAFFALLAHGADMNFSPSSVERMLHEAIAGRARMPTAAPIFFSYNIDYDAVVRHILQHGQPDLQMSIEIPAWDVNYPSIVRGHRFTPKELAKACCTETETWFLALLRECRRSHYFSEEDELRLRALRLGSHASQGCVLGENDDLSEDDEGDPSDDWTDEDDPDDGGDDNDRGYDHEGDASSFHDDTSDVGEEEQFWDAEQGL